MSESKKSTTSTAECDEIDKQLSEMATIESWSDTNLKQLRSVIDQNSGKVEEIKSRLRDFGFPRDVILATLNNYTFSEYKIYALLHLLSDYVRRAANGETIMGLTFTRLISNRGGFGIVFEAIDKGGNKYAVKLPKPKLAKLIWEELDNDTESLADEERKNILSMSIQELCNFFDEYRLMHACSDIQGVVSVQSSLSYFPAISPDFSDEDLVESLLTHAFDWPIMIRMELVEGPSLLERVEAEERLSTIEACRVMRSVAKTCSQLHSREITHQDLKLSNILQGRYGEIKICDLGGALNRYQSPKMIRTRSHVAPEVEQDSQYVSPKNDVYSWAVCFTHAITGQSPFAQDAKKDDKGHHWVFHKLEQEQPKEIVQLIKDCLNDNPNLRPTFTAISSRLSKFVLKRRLRRVSVVALPVAIVFFFVFWYFSSTEAIAEASFKLDRYDQLGRHMGTLGRDTHNIFVNERGKLSGMLTRRAFVRLAVVLPNGKVKSCSINGTQTVNSCIEINAPSVEKNAWWTFNNGEGPHAFVLFYSPNKNSIPSNQQLVAAIDPDKWSWQGDKPAAWKVNQRAPYRLTMDYQFETNVSKNDNQDRDELIESNRLISYLKDSIESECGDVQFSVILLNVISLEE